MGAVMIERGADRRAASRGRPAVEPAVAGRDRDGRLGAGGDEREMPGDGGGEDRMQTSGSGSSSG